MIVMKFGGTSTASAKAIRQVASIVRAELERRPVVVVSAMGDTTDRLLSILRETALSHTEESCRIQAELRDKHLRVAGELLTGNDADWASSNIQRLFRDLHVRMLEVIEAERTYNAELKDWVISLGEQLSGIIVAAAFRSLGMPAVHVDARRLIVTDDRFTEAKPKLPETYAKLRWSIPVSGPEGAVVLGGFIGATEDGRTTTLGRGGSDLTASIVGAALNAEEIQVWKDVDGMLTCDPRLHNGGLCVKQLTYPEAANLAQSGAKILHPDTIAPARRLRIPIYLRNTFHPEVKGTRICGETTPGIPATVKSIACRKGLHLLRIRPGNSALSRDQICENVERSLEQQRIKVTFLGQTEKDIVLAIDGHTDFSRLVFGFEGCLQVHLQSNQTLITLVGDRIAGCSQTANKILKALANLKGAAMLPAESGSCYVRVAVAEKDTLLFLERIHAALFSQPDASLFERSLKPQTAPRTMEAAPVVRPAAVAWRPNLSDPVKAL